MMAIASANARAIFPSTHPIGAHSAENVTRTSLCTAFPQAATALSQENTFPNESANAIMMPP
jgi:hypothetical protein